MRARPGSSPHPWGVTSDQRFGRSPLPVARETRHDHELFRYELPAGWLRLPAADFREIHLRPAGDPDAECYLTVLLGARGGLGPNVDRWREQMGLEPLGEGELDALPRGLLLGAEAVLVELEGTYRGMGGDPSSEPFGLLGLVVDLGVGTATLKFVGPRELVLAEREAFLALARSVEMGHAHEHTHAPLNAGGPVSAEPPGADEDFLWQVPPGWVRQPDRAMRVVTLAPAGARDAECYVAVLAGSGGGLEANLNRWREQMGLAHATPEELAAWPHVELLGDAVPMLDATGIFRGMGPLPPLANARMFGAVRLLADRAVFVKMTGPAAVLDGEREAFVDFCRSLRLR